MPEEVYRSLGASESGIGNYLGVHVPVPDGTYTMRLHFMEPSYQAAGLRRFDIFIQDRLVKSAYDIFADAGARDRATTQSFSVVAANDQGIDLRLTNLSTRTSILAGLELFALNPEAAGSAGVDLQLSLDDGQTWDALAEGLPLDRYGQGVLPWNAGPQTDGATARLLVRLDDPNMEDTSQHAFLIAGNGSEYFINDGESTSDAYTTALGHDRHSGKSPAQPMASLAAPLDAYDLDPGDTIYVDTGSYELLRNVQLTADDEGVRIVGREDGSSLLDRNNTHGGSYGFELSGAGHITLEALSLTGAYQGVYAGDQQTSSNLTVIGSTIFGNYDHGIWIAAGNDDARLINNTLYGLPGGSSQDNQLTGIELRGDGWTVDNNVVFDTAGTGMLLFGENGRAVNNELFRNQTGVSAYSSSTGPQQTVLSHSRIYDHLYTGMQIGGHVLATDNDVANQPTGVDAYGSAELRDNLVHGNVTGITASGEAVICGNRVYENTTTGIQASDQALVCDNYVYSNSEAMLLGSYFDGRVTDNLVYANTNLGVRSLSDELQFHNNTVYQGVGDALRLEAGASNVTVMNNILWVDAGYDIYVAGNTTGLTSDFNLLHQGDDPDAHVGFWSGTAYDTLAEWQTASLLDQNSLAADPLFVDTGGADNVLGGDGGHDDNFELGKHSPAIDRGHPIVASTHDMAGRERHDDPGTVNAGGGDFVEQSLGASLFELSGTAQNWRSGGAAWTLALPFAFPFYLESYDTVQVSSEGFLHFAGYGWTADGSNTTQKLLDNARIAPLWDNLRTDQAGDDIFVDATVADQVTVRWNATTTVDYGDANFSVTLFANGNIRFDYGPGNSNLTPTVGISRGNGEHYLLATYDGLPTLTDVPSIALDLVAGYVDLGSYEFPGFQPG